MRMMAAGPDYGVSRPQAMPEPSASTSPIAVMTSVLVQKKTPVNELYTNEFIK